MSGRVFTRKVVIDDITFDSEIEGQYYELLKNRLNSNTIRDLQVHKSYVLVDGYINGQGIKIAPITYEPDFIFYDLLQQKYRFVDVKGMLFDDFKLKWKMFDKLLLSLYPNCNYYLECLKYSKTTDWVDIRAYKKIMRDKKHKIAIEKNNLKKDKEQLEKDIKKYKELCLKEKLTEKQKICKETLEIKLKDYIIKL